MIRLGQVLVVFWALASSDAGNALTEDYRLPADRELLMATGQGSNRSVIVASKPFGESYLLAEMFAQLLESRGVFNRPLAPGMGDIIQIALRIGNLNIERGRKLTVAHGHQCRRHSGCAARALGMPNLRFQR